MMESPHSKSVQGPWRRGGAFPQLRHQELKEQAVAFYSEHKVQDALEGLLNEMFLIKPRDVYGYMVSVRQLLITCCLWDQQQLIISIDYIAYR